MRRLKPEGAFQNVPCFTKLWNEVELLSLEYPERIGKGVRPFLDEIHRRLSMGLVSPDDQQKIEIDSRSNLGDFRRKHRKWDIEQSQALAKRKLLN